MPGCGKIAFAPIASPAVRARPPSARSSDTGFTWNEGSLRCPWPAGRMETMSTPHDDEVIARARAIFDKLRQGEGTASEAETEPAPVHEPELDPEPVAVAEAEVGLSA